MIGGSVLIWSVGRCSVVGGSLEDLRVVGCLWSVSQWRTCRWVDSRLSVVGWSVEDLPVGQ